MPPRVSFHDIKTRLSQGRLMKLEWHGPMATRCGGSYKGNNPLIGYALRADLDALPIRATSFLINPKQRIMHAAGTMYTPHLIGVARYTIRKDKFGDLKLTFHRRGKLPGGQHIIKKVFFIVPRRQ